jgi:hypothetical protein
MKNEANELLPKKRRKRSNEKSNSVSQTNSLQAKEEGQLPVNSSINTELEEIMEAEYGIHCRQTLIVIYDKVELTMRSVKVKKPFNQIGKGLRAMRLSIIRKKMNPNEIIVNEEIILAIEYKTGQ